MITTETKLVKKYAYKPHHIKADVMDVDTSKNMVSGILNTYNYIDSDIDMLIMGCCAKSISDRGVNSNAKAKIQHLRDHKLTTDNIIGKFTVLEETTYEGRDVLAFTSKIIDRSTLLLYQEKIINQHSIGFKYEDIEFAYRDSDDNDERKKFDEYKSRAINPDVADDYGYFFIIKEIKLYEGSSVVFGANSETEVTGIKSKDPQTQQTYLLAQLELLTKNFRNGQFSDEHFKLIELQIKQIEQAIMDIQPPSLKDTLKREPSPEKGKDVLNFYEQLKF